MPENRDSRIVALLDQVADKKLTAEEAYDQLFGETDPAGRLLVNIAIKGKNTRDINFSLPVELIQHINQLLPETFRSKLGEFQDGLEKIAAMAGQKQLGEVLKIESDGDLIIISLTS
jgi:hypothetical protein